MGHINKRIIYQNDNGGLSIIIPADCGLTVEEIAAKDVPAGVPYCIINDTDIPADRSSRNAWTADFTHPDGYGIGAEAWFAEQAKEATV